MKRMFRMGALIAVMTLLTAIPASAQSYSTSFGIRGGGIWSTSFAPGTLIEDDLRLDMTWLGGAELEHWFGGGRVGFRVGGAFTNGDVLPGRAANLYLGDATLMLRLLAPRPDRLIAPYIAIGGGGVHYNWEADAPPQFKDGADVDRLFEPITRPAGNVAFGLDLNPVTGVGLRLEASDYVLLESPYVEFESGSPESMGPVHHVRFTGSIQFRFGDLGPDRPVLAYAPSADDAPEPTPVAEEPVETAPEPEISDERADDLGSELSSVQARLSAVERALARNTARVQSLNEQMEALGQRPVRPPSPSPARDASPPVSGQYFTVQVAAFTDAAKARQMAGRLRADGVPVRVVSAVANGRTYYRVRVGALPTAGETQRLGRWVRNTYGTKIWVAPVASSESVTEAVVVATRELLRSSD